MVAKYFKEYSLNAKHKWRMLVKAPVATVIQRPETTFAYSQVPGYCRIRNTVQENSLRYEPVQYQCTSDDKYCNANCKPCIIATFYVQNLSVYG